MAITDLPVLDITSYNNYEFPSNVETTSYGVTPLKDPSGRTVWACEFKISLSWYDSDLEGRGGSIDARSRDAVARLTKSAGELKYRGRGFGTPPTVNGGARVRDVNWGPVPGPLEMVPHAGVTVKYSWSVTFTLPTCDDGVFFGLAWFVYSLQFARDAHGYTTRTYNAKLRIAQTKPTVDARLITDSADRYFEFVVPALLKGFRRESVTRTLSEDKSELSVVVVDAQMPPNAPPANVVLAEVSHTYQSENIVKWVGTLSATYDVPYGATVLEAVLAFFELLKDRMDRALLTSPAESGGKVTVVPVSATVTEPNIYGRTQAAFTFTYRLSGVLFPDVVASSGLWAPIPKKSGGDTWSEWAASVPSVLAPRGHADLRFRPGEDKIVDLCRENPPSVPGAAPPVPGGSGGLLGRIRERFAAGGFAAAVGAVFKKPTPAASWLDYSPRVLIVADTGRVPVTTLPEVPLSSAPRQNAQGAWDAFKGPLPSDQSGSFGLIPGAQLGANVQNGGETVVQQRNKPNFYVVFTGTAMRAHYPIPCPELLSVNGKKPTLMGQPQFETFMAPASLTPVVCARWALVYLFTDDQGGAPARPVGPVPTARA